MRLLDEAGYRDPDGEGPQPRLRLSLKISSNEETRLQSTVVQQDLRRVGIELDLRSYEFATFFADVLKGNFQMFSLHLDRWLAGGSRHPAASVPLRPDTAARLQSRLLPQPGRRSTARPRHAVRRTRTSGRAHYREAQKLIAEDAPYIPIWNRTNVIVAQQSLDGLHLNAIGDFQALRDVKRR